MESQEDLENKRTKKRNIKRSKKEKQENYIKKRQ